MKLKTGSRSPTLVHLINSKQENMSRCHEWNSAFEGIANYLQSKGAVVNNHNFKVESNILNNYCKEKNIQGSFSERVLKVSSEFKSFKEWFKALKS